MSEQSTMFGVPSEQPEAIKVRRAREKVTGYADDPGTGPAGETCGACFHFIRREYAGTYFKCRLVVGDRDSGSHGAGTDIRKGSPACSQWKKDAEPV